MFGVTDNGNYKYYCEKCHNIEVSHTKGVISH